MTSFTPTFGGTVNQPAQVGYASYSFTSALTLEWPTGLQDTASPAAAWVDVVTTSAGAQLTLPDATEGSVGGSVLFNNRGANSFQVMTQSGTEVVVVSAGTQQFVLLADNSTTAGTWRAVQFGAVVAQAQASSLAGAGLGAAAGLLRVQWPVTTINSSYSVTAGDRATILEWTGGVGTLTFPAGSTLGNNYVVGVVNQGTGTLTLAPSSGTIDGDASIQILQDESCFVISDGTNYVTVGRGRSVSFTVTALSKSLAGSGESVLSTAEAAAQIQEFTGALTGDRTVTYGTSPNMYDIYNNTTGSSYTVTFRATSGDTGVIVAQGNRGILANDGAAVRSYPTQAGGSVTYVGTAARLTGGNFTTSGTLDLATVSGTPGTYDPAAITVDQWGRTTSAGVSLAALVVDSSRTVSAGVITFSGGRATAQPTPVTWSSVMMLNMGSSHNFDIVAASSPTAGQITVTGSPVWGQGGVISVQNNASGNATLTFSPANTWFSSVGGTIGSTAGGRTSIPYYVDSTAPLRIMIAPTYGFSSL